MSLKFYDRVLETTPTSGTGAVSMLGAVAGFQSFSSVFSLSSTIQYLITDGVSWEVGQGTLTGSEVLSRDVVYASSNGNALVSFGTNIKSVSCDLNANWLNQVDALVNGDGIIGSDAHVLRIYSKVLFATTAINAATITTGTLALDFNAGSYNQVTLNQNITTFTVANSSATGQSELVIKFTANGTAYTVTWPTGTKWAGGAAPTLTSTNGKSDFIRLLTDNAGTNWYGFVLGQNF